MKKKLFLFFGLGLLLYLLTTGLSWAAFSYLAQPPKVEELKSPLPLLTKGGLKFDEGLPKTETCPLNGALYSKSQKDWWEKHRPLGVMIENHQEARPQSGLTRADIVYEAVAEGGITRFLALYLCQDAEPVGPVRSARTYFLDFISEYGEKPLYTHVGGANTPGPANALGQIEGFGWLGKNDLNQFSIGFPTFWRDYERLGKPVATEHTMYSTTTKLWELAQKRGLTEKDEKGKSWDQDFQKWRFKEDLKEEARPASFSAEFNFWQGYDAYQVRWEYDRTVNSYRRFNGGALHLDKNDTQPILAKNIVIVFMSERQAADGYENNAHLLYGTKGKGKAIVLQDGEAIEGQWQKGERLSRMKFQDAKGREIEFNRGQIWLEILPQGNQVNFQ